MNRPFLATSLAALAVVLVIAPATAKSARCFTSDDGHYPCTFSMTDSDGSFEITAPGKPSFRIAITGQGTAAGFIGIDGHFTALPGSYVRSKADRACWENAGTETRICAW